MLRLLAVAMLLAGCAARGDVPAEHIPRSGASDLVLRVFDTGGLIGPGEDFKLPAVSIYGDGLVVLADKESGPVKRRLTPAGVRWVVQAALGAGLAQPRNLGYPQVLDGGVTIFTLATRKGRYVTEVVMLTYDDDYTVEQSRMRQKLIALRKGLRDLDAWLGDEVLPDRQPYTGPGILFSYKTSSTVKAEGRWPLADLATLGVPHSVGRCALISDQVESGAWLSGDDVYLVTVRPRLPDESSCADIKRLGGAG